MRNAFLLFLIEPLFGMDFSTYIKNQQTATIWSDYQRQVLQTQPTYNSTTALSTLNTAYYNYMSYAQKDQIAQGRVTASTMVTQYIDSAR